MYDATQRVSLPVVISILQQSQSNSRFLLVALPSGLLVRLAWVVRANTNGGNGYKVSDRGHTTRTRRADNLAAPNSVEDSRPILEQCHLLNILSTLPQEMRTTRHFATHSQA